VLRSVAVIATVLCASSPATAWAHIYKWVDERGMTVYSNVLPEKSPKNVQMVIEEKPADRAPAREQQLLERIANLERQLQAQQSQQYPQYPQYIPQPPPSVDYGGYYQGYYPPYPYSYPYPYVVVTRRFIGPARSFLSPRFASAHVGSFHHGGMSRGRR